MFSTPFSPSAASAPCIETISPPTMAATVASNRVTSRRLITFPRFAASMFASSVLFCRFARDRRPQRRLPARLRIGVLPFHDIARSGGADPAGAEPLINPQCTAQIMHVQANRLASHGGLEAHTRHHDAPDPAIAILRENRDIEHAHLVVAVIDIQPPDRPVGPLDDAVVRL